MSSTTIHATNTSSQYHVTPGTVIILNGPSASGKSSLQKALQQLLETPSIALGIDDLFNDIIPDEFGSKVTLKTDPKLYRHVTFETDKNGHSVVPLFIGPEGQKVIKGMHGAIGAYARAGNTCIVDYIAYEPHWWPHLMSELKDLKVFTVGVDISLETLEDREKKRGTSPLGHSRSHYDNVHHNKTYNLRVNTEKMSPLQAAKAILEGVCKGP